MASIVPLLQLDACHVDVWLAHYAEIGDTDLLGAMRQLLSVAEQAQEARFVRADDRQRYLVTRAMVRSVLSRYASVAPGDWLFVHNAHGRPRIAEAVRDSIDIRVQVNGLDFNISHTRGMIVMAVSRDRTVGIDVENTRRQRDGLDIATQYFSPSEAADLAALDAAQRQDRFTQYWTLKEAYSKARGLGLSLPLDQFSFDFIGADRVRFSTAPSLGDAAASWRFWQLRPSNEHILALCAQQCHGADTLLTVRTVTPLLSEETITLPLLVRSFSA